MKKYGLWHKSKKCLLGFHTIANEFEDTHEVQYILDTFSNNIWLVDSYKEAHYAKTHDTEWYNASYETPSNKFCVEEIEVKEVNLSWK